MRRSSWIFYDDTERGGVHLPIRWLEPAKRPIPIDVRVWRMTGLDMNRGTAPR